MIYGVLVTVEQVVTKDIEMAVEASSEEEAGRLAAEAAMTYPEEISGDAVKRACTVRSKYWTPRDIEVTIQEN